MNRLGNCLHVSLREADGTSVEAYYDERMCAYELPVNREAGTVEPSSCAQRCVMGRLYAHVPLVRRQYGSSDPELADVPCSSWALFSVSVRF